MYENRHILVVDDDKEACTLLERILSEDGFLVTVADSRMALMRCLEEYAIDLITLDISLNGDDGLEVARHLRETRDTPIVIITARTAADDRVHGLESGADDYITKPFDRREVILRIRKILGRYKIQTSPMAMERYRLDFGVLDVARRELRSLAGDLVEITAAEFDLLTIFVRQPSRILSRDEIMRRLKGRAWSPLERTLDKHVAQLRKKIELTGDPPQMIKSVRAVGYVYAGKVEPA